ncbi:hypothetical protein LOTGIDRAFT_230242 [Lottia gigantea]|uniref:Monocyte to macrophage differentiation factor 2 n=1 Tax=Lottia gigantea TaxID=225164 RepID=V4B106_LOTGI|nr:hypothetical protein LOTGIDRAFT_230242 [Lottia gigantea]ESP03948.1 hypothetical protein LOTGIDRAFT_230242 [Lottia gigantea]
MPREAPLSLINRYLHHNRQNGLMNERAKPGTAYRPTDLEHIANVLTHGIWVLPSLLCGIWMMYIANNSLQYVSAVIYGAALWLLFTVSTTFHTLSYSGKFSSLKNFFHIGDRAVIYIFIAASYTPWLCIKDFNQWGNIVLWLVWIMAICGILYQYIFHEQYKLMETIFYLIIGVCPASVAFLMTEDSGLTELSLGGATYIIGVIFFKSDGLIPFAHAIWHCFVLVGSMFHYYGVVTHLLGPKDNLSNVDIPQPLHNEL